MKTIHTIELADVTGGFFGGASKTTELQEKTTAVNLLGCMAQVQGAQLPAGVTNPYLYPSTAAQIRNAFGSKPAQ